MEDVFDLSGKPPSGWMHAVFNGGPYAEDIGRCIPGPPAPERITVSLPEGGETVYWLWAVGSWSAPDDPIAVYNDTGTVPDPSVSDAETLRLDRRADQ